MSDATSTSIGGRLTLPAFIQWAVALFKSPRSFFQRMERSGGYGTPVLYLAGWSFLSAVISFLVAFVRPGQGIGRGLQALGLVVGPLGALAMAFGLVAVYLFVIWHWMGSKENFETAFRIWAFMAPVGAVTALLGILPILQVVVSLAYMLYLIVIASQEVHGIDARRSWIVWGVLGGILLLFTVATVVASRFAPMGRGGAASSFR